MVHVIARVCIVLAALAAATTARAESLAGHYFMVVWGYEGRSGAPEQAHTFVSFYRGGELGKPVTISWLPASGIVRPGVVVPGRNFTLAETLQIARSRGARLRSYGPYEIQPDLYRRAVERAGELNAGRWDYTMVNGPSGAMNCIAAAGGVGGPITTGFDYGYAASNDVVRHLGRWIIDNPETQQQVAERLQLDVVAGRVLPAPSTTGQGPIGD